MQLIILLIISNTHTYFLIYILFVPVYIFSTRIIKLFLYIKVWNISSVGKAGDSGRVSELGLMLQQLDPILSID